MNGSTDVSPKRLVVIPSNSIRDFEKAGYQGLNRYYNPGQLFDEVFVLSPFEDEDRQAHGMTIRRVAASRFRHAIRELRPQVVRAYGGHWPADVACRNRVPGVPILVSVHDPTPESLYPVVRYADMVLCVSGVVQRAVRAVGTEPERIRRLPNRVDTNLFRPFADRSAWAAVADRFGPGKHILHVGRKDPAKNLETLIGALAYLPGDYSAVFVGLGDAGPFRALAEAQGVADRCFWIDSVKNSELPHWYAWCDCMCTPSRWEGFGIVFIEAAACGAPIITSDIAPMNEYLTHGTSAHLVGEYEDAQAVARAIRSVCEDEDYRRALSAGALEAAKPFQQDHVDELEVAIYREVINRPSRELSRTERLRLEWSTICRNARRVRKVPAKVLSLRKKF